MSEEGKALIKIDLDQFKMHVKIKDNVELSLHFDSPSRKFYLSVMAFVVHEMQKLGEITSIPLEEHYDVLALLNETIGGSAGSSKRKKLIPRIYKKWKNALPDLENAPLFRVLGKKKEYGEAIGRTYSFTEEEKDRWANLFEYKGSEEKVRLRFSLDKLGASLDDVVITFKEDLKQADISVWGRFLDTLEKERIEEQAQMQTLAEPSRAMAGRRRWVALAVVVALILLAGALAIWSAYLRSPPLEPASMDKMAFPLPDKPAIAVLPFVNMSEDPKLDYFSDGLTEEIITALSLLPEMFVIARNSTFTYKGNPVKVQQVAEELGVRYVLEGSVRVAGERVRIIAQLSDALNGNHLWAERYERELKDIFAVQDEITERILAIVEVRVKGEKTGRSYYFKHTDNLAAYIKFSQAKGYINTGIVANFSKARHLAEEAIILDPEFPAAYRILAWAHLMEYLSSKKKSSPESLRLAHELSEKALAMNESNPHSYRLLGTIYLFRKEYEKATSLFQQTVELDPNESRAYMSMAWCLIYTERPQDAIPFLKKAMRLNPLDKMFQSKCLLRLGIAYSKMGRYAEAIPALEKALQIRPGHGPTQHWLLATYSFAGREEDARIVAEEFLRTHPKFSLKKLAKRLPYKNQAEMDRFIDALRKAGLK